MFDRISEMIELLLVNFGMMLTRMSDQEKRMISLFLGSLFVAAVVARALQIAVLR